MTPDAYVRRANEDNWLAALSMASLAADFEAAKHRSNPLSDVQPSAPAEKERGPFGLPISSALVCVVLLVAIVLGMILAASSLLPSNKQLGAYVSIAIGGFLLYGVISFLVSLPGILLSWKFKGLGELSGRHLSEIVAVAGAPNSSSIIGNGQVLHQWLVAGYHIALCFENDVCLGVQHASELDF